MWHPRAVVLYYPRVVTFVIHHISRLLIKILCIKQKKGVKPYGLTPRSSNV